MDQLPAILVFGHCAFTNFVELVNRLGVNLAEELFGTKILITDLFDPAQAFRERAFVLSNISLDFLHQLVKEHLHDSEIVFKLLHDFLSKGTVHK